MATRYLLDTNALTALAKRDPAATSHWQTLLDEDTVHLCFVVVGEWEYGIQNIAGLRRQRDIRASGGAILAALDDVLESDPAICNEYGALSAHLRASGRQIPTNDAWIAAVALVHDATLITTDPHFKSVPGLRVQDWTKST